MVECHAGNSHAQPNRNKPTAKISGSQSGAAKRTRTARGRAQNNNNKCNTITVPLNISPPQEYRSGCHGFPRARAPLNGNARRRPRRRSEIAGRRRQRRGAKRRERNEEDREDRGGIASLVCSPARSNAVPVRSVPESNAPRVTNERRRVASPHHKLFLLRQPACAARMYPALGNGRTA